MANLFLPLAVMRSLGVLNIPLIELICSLLPQVIFCPIGEMSPAHLVVTFMSASLKLIMNEDLTACLVHCSGKQ